MKTYLCTVSGKFPENYQIGVQANRWGAEERYLKRIKPVQEGDQILFLVGGVFRTIHKIESCMFEEHSLL